jgi:hypothetical protein
MSWVEVVHFNITIEQRDEGRRGRGARWGAFW